MPNYGLISKVGISDYDINTTDVSAWNDALDDGSSTVRGHLRIFRTNDSDKWVTFNITGANSAGGAGSTAYEEVQVQYVDSND